MSGTVLSIEDLTKMIGQAQTGAADPLHTAMQILSGLGDEVAVTGDVLRQALRGSGLPLDDAAAPLIAGIEAIVKSGNSVHIMNAGDSELVVKGMQLRLKKHLGFTVELVNGLPKISNIDGLSVRKFLWIAVKGFHFFEKDGVRMVKVDTGVASAVVKVPERLSRA